VVTSRVVVEAKTLVELVVEVLVEDVEVLEDVLVEVTGIVEELVVMSRVDVVVTFVPPSSEQPGRNTNKNRKNTTNNRIRPLNVIRR
jgi:hypothetical protein